MYDKYSYEGVSFLKVTVNRAIDEIAWIEPRHLVRAGSTVLSRTGLCCNILRCTVLYCAVLYRAVLYRAVLRCTMLCCVVLCGILTSVLLHHHSMPTLQYSTIGLLHSLRDWKSQLQ